jgi:cytochrome c-type biogenesis protein CcmH/NrfG
VLYGEGHIDEAVARYREALRLKPDYFARISQIGMTIASFVSF